MAFLSRVDSLNKILLNVLIDYLLTRRFILIRICMLEIAKVFFLRKMFKKEPELTTKDTWREELFTCLFFDMFATSCFPI